MKYKKDDICYIVENKCKVSQVRIMRIEGDFAMVRFIEKDSAIRIRLSRLYQTEDEAKEYTYAEIEKKRIRKSLYDYLH